METMEFMKKVAEVHGRLEAVASEHGIGFTAAVAAGQKGEDALTVAVSNMEYSEQVLALHLFHNYVHTHHE